MNDLRSFMTESLGIEGIHRPPTKAEVTATLIFLSESTMTLEAICAVQSVYAPGMPLRIQSGMDVRVGGHMPIRGGEQVTAELRKLCDLLESSRDPWRLHCAFETLHPFMDGNGRTGRILWAWHMKEVGQNPFALSFLHRWYYQTLAGVDRA